MENETSPGSPLISLVGAPNSGKTTLFNYLSGKNYKTVNYPGSTVEYSFAPFLEKFELNANLLDTPGIISLNAASPDEKVAIDSLFYHPDYGTPSLILVSVDASQLSRHLLLVRQMLHHNFNIIVILTMNDILERKGYSVSAELLSGYLECPVVRINSKTGEGIQELIEIIKTNLIKNEIPLPPRRFGRHHDKSHNHHHFWEKHGKKHGEGKHSHKHFHHAGGRHHRFDDGSLRDSHKLIKDFKEIEKIESVVLRKSQSHISHKKLEKINRQFNILNNRPDEFTIKVDRFLLHKYWGLLSFFAIMAFTFTSIFWLAAPIMELINSFFSFLSEFVVDSLGHSWLSDLLANGLISGFGAVLVFMPQIIILFLILGLLEDSGYLARGAMLVDKPLSKIGLNGKSFVPMLSGFACAIPATLATRTISNRKERLLTIFILPLMTCSARLPVYALLIAFITPADKPWIGGFLMAAIYITGIFISVFVAALLNKVQKVFINKNDDSSFILELPTYKRPVLGVVAAGTYNNTKHYIKRAGPVILSLSLVLWLLTYFPNSNPKVDVKNLPHNEAVEKVNAERLAGSYSAALGKFIEPVMEPLGLDWRVGTALISTFAAREVFVSSLAVIFKVTAADDNIQNSILKAMRDAEVGDSGKKLFTTATIIGLIIFFMLALQCISTIAISYKETGGWKVPLLQVLFFSSTAYLLSFLAVTGLRAIGIN
jgi:ferrous iron transport protein B